MGKLSRRKSALRPGEIIALRSKLGVLPEGCYRVDGVGNQLLNLSLGRISLGVNPDTIEIVGRRLPEPATWLPMEVALLRMTACRCSECREALAKAEAELAAYKQAA